MKKDKFDDYTDSPHFDSMEDVEKLVGGVWEALREEAKHLLDCKHEPEEQDDEKVSLHHTLKIIRDMIDDAETGMKRARTETEAKVQYAILRKLLAWRDEVEEEFYDACVITSMMYQEAGANLSWIK